MIGPVRFDPVATGQPRDSKPTDYVLLYMLWCDQGMAHLVEVYDGEDDSIPKAMLLIDFGAEVMKKTTELTVAQAAPSVNFIIQRLLTIAQRGRPPRFERVVISHQDADHWSMIEQLINQLKAHEMALSIGEIRYGGVGWKPKAKQILRNLATFSGSRPPIPWKNRYSDYHPSTHTKTSFFSELDIHFRILRSSIKTKSKAPSLIANASSAVVVIDLGTSTFILPGDATYETLASCNAKIASWMEGGNENPVRPCFFFGAPHHGAFATMAATGKDVEPFQILQEFIENTQPQTVGASAGAENSFRHPYGSVLGLCAKYARQSRSLHRIVFWDDSALDPEERVNIPSWRVAESMLDIYTTIVDLPYRRLHGNVQYEYNKTSGLVIASNWHFYLKRNLEYDIDDDPFEAPTELTEEIEILVEDTDAMDESNRRSGSSESLRRLISRLEPVTRVIAKSRKREG